MEPIGLTRKIDGELMIAHLCLNCNKISCNRIAGDDNSYIITCLLKNPESLTREIITRLAGQSIELLTQIDSEEVLVSLYGYDYRRYQK